MSTAVPHSPQIAHETIMAGGKGGHRARHHAAMRSPSRSAGAASKPLVTLVAVMLAAAACSPLALSSPGAATGPIVAVVDRATDHRGPGHGRAVAVAVAVVRRRRRGRPPAAAGERRLRLPARRRLPATARRDRRLARSHGVTRARAATTSATSTASRSSPARRAWWTGEAPGPDAARRQRQARDRPRLGRDDARPDDGREARRARRRHRRLDRRLRGRRLRRRRDRQPRHLHAARTAASARTTPSPRCACSPTPRTPSASRSRRRTRPRSSAGASEMGTDFAVAEECNRYTECDAYTGGVRRPRARDRVPPARLRRRLRRVPGLSIVLRDLDLVPPADKGYVYRSCRPGRPVPRPGAPANPAMPASEPWASAAGSWLRSRRAPCRPGQRRRGQGA